IFPNRSRSISACPIQAVCADSTNEIPQVVLRKAGEIEWPGSCVLREEHPVAIFGSEAGRFLVMEGSQLPTSSTPAALLRGRINLFGLLLLVSAFGCSHEGYVSQQGLAQRILPPPNSENHEAVPPPNNAQEDSSALSAAQTEQTKPDL